jgi:hypothetical protein
MSRGSSRRTWWRTAGTAPVGEFARTPTATDVFSGWTENVAIRNSAYKWILAEMETVADRLPFPLTGLDTDDGGEFINPGGAVPAASCDASEFLGVRMDQAPGWSSSQSLALLDNPPGELVRVFGSDRHRHG